MTKLDFLYELREALSSLPREDIERYVDYYSEMIDDRIDDGMNEADAVAEMGSVADVAQRILGDTSPQEPVKKAEKPERRSGWRQMLLIVLGFPLWLPLLIAAFAVLFSLFAALFSVVISLWSVVVSLWGTALGGLVLGAVALVSENLSAGLALMGIALFSAGLSLFGIFGCKAATKGAGMLTVNTAKGIKKVFVRKEGAK